MSFPGIIRRLFANEGAGPLLRKEIIPFIPFGTTTGTVCEGDDSRLADWAEVRAALKKELALLQAQRLQSIGVPKFWTSTELPDSDHCWPDGSLVLFADRPEFKAKYDAGGFAGMLLPAGSSNETIAANLGKWVEHPNGLGLYAPQLGDQFFRAWTLGAGREAGGWQQDAVETGITSIYCEPMGGYGDNYPATVTLEGNVSLHDTGYADSIIVYMTDIGTPVVHRRYYINQRQALETRPVNIAQPSIIYLGLPA